ncbi:type II/IV secretion system protein [Candidatus Parcubacteria bacterium]|nr:type II/IV secretion system protein [Candidatus Parcubacteria bacterium]
MTKIAGKFTISKINFDNFQEKIKNIDDFKKELENASEKKTSDLLEIILTGAIILDASDFHIEPEEKQARTRARIDGMLQDATTLKPEIYNALLSRIKMLSGIKLNITNKAQDGRFSVVINTATIEVRASTLPAEYGESIVLRILNPKNLMELEKLGLRNSLLAIFNQEVKKPNGMIIVTGPTGSGKTTTLYAFLKKIQKPEIKIITIEDPIEYHLKGISQTQVDPKKGYDFANGLRSIMRQDPNVILVGEIRDFETAQIALQAALTGHLVLSTLHANDAASTISRLIDLGVSPNSIAPGLNMVVAQRLVRKVCKKCAKLEEISVQDMKQIKKALKNISSEIKIPDLNGKIKIYKTGKGCEYCNFTGHKERTGIFESFINNDEIKQFILSSSSASGLRQIIIKRGMLTLYQDGLIKVLKRETTLEEIKRATGK